MKITLIESREYEFESRTNPGDTISGYQNAGYDEQNQLIQFSSRKSHQGDVIFATKYNPNEWIEVDLQPKVFAGKVKWREIE